MKVIALVAAALLLLMPAPAQRSKPTNPGGLAVGVAEYPVTFGVENPAELLGMLLAALAPRMLRPEVLSALRIVDEELESEIGFRLSKPGSWSDVGIHPQGALRMSVLGFGSWGFPDPSVLSFDTRDQKKLLDYLAKMMGSQWVLDEGKPLVYLDNGGRTAVGFLGGRMYLYGGSSVEGTAMRLRQTLGGVGRRRTITLDPTFDLVKAEAKGPLPLAIFVNLQSIEELAGEPDLHLPQSLLIALGTQGLVAGVSLPKESRILEVKAGAECRDFIGRFDQPTFAMSVSMADPLASLRDVVAEFLPSELPTLDEITTRPLEQAGLNREFLERQFTDCSAALLVYPETTSVGVHELVVCLRVQDIPAMRKELAVQLPAGRYGFELMEEGKDHILLRAPDGRDEVIIGLVDEYLILSNTAERMELMVAGKATAWKPSVGGKQVFAFELFPGDLAEMIGFSLWRAFDPFVDSLHLYGEIEIKPEGLVGRIRPAGDRPASEMLADFLEGCLMAFVQELGHEIPAAPDGRRRR